MNAFTEASLVEHRGLAVLFPYVQHLPERRPMKTRAPQRFIYVIGPLEGAQKVGLTTDLKSRLTALQTACSQDLVLHVAVRVPFDEAHAIERRVHRMLVRSHVKNEWFDVVPAQAMSAVLQAARLGLLPAHTEMPSAFRETGQPLLPYLQLSP